MKITEGKYKHLLNLSNEKGTIAAAAMDQRGSLKKAIAKAKGVDPLTTSSSVLEEFKTAVSKVLTPHATAILLDPEYGLPAAKARSKNAGLLAVEILALSDNDLRDKLKAWRKTQASALPEIPKG